MTDPREASPGPGLWTVTDLDSRMQVTQGKLFFRGTSGVWDRTMLLLQTPFARHKGRYVEFQFTPDTNDQDMQVTWQSAPRGQIDASEAGIRFGGGGYILGVDGPGTYISTALPYAGGHSYAVRLYDGGPVTMAASSNGGGDLYCYVRETTTDQWTLLWRKPSSSGQLTQLYVGLNNIGHTGTMDYVRVRNARLLEVWGYVALPISGDLLCAQADGLAEVLVEAPESGAATLLFRWSDAQNYFSLALSTDLGRVDLLKTVAGITTRVGSRALPVAPERLYLLRAVLHGAGIETFVGRQPGPATVDSFNQTTGLLCGFQGPGDAFNLRFEAGGNLLW